MNSAKVLQPGLFAMIELKPGENWPFTIGSVSEDQSTITCELLTEEPRSIDLSDTKELLVVCSTESGVYRFPVRVVSVDEDPVRLTLALHKGTVHIQRRDFFRLSRPLVLARYRPITGPDDIFSKELKDAPVKDLSGNGVALVVDRDEELAAGVPIRTEMQLANGQVVVLVGEVVRCIPNEPVNGKSLMCIYFSLIEERDRDRIIGQLFREQLDRAGKRHRVNRRTT